MRGVWGVGVGLIFACWGEGASARAEDAAKPEESSAVGSVDVTLDATSDPDAEIGPTSIADAHEQFAPVLSPSPTLSLSDWSNHALVYTGLDGWRLGGSAYVGSEWSPSVDSPFILRAFASDGIDDYKTPEMTFRVQTARASFLPGYHYKSDTLDLKLFVGGDFMLRSLVRPAINVWSESFGARAGLDLWWEPSKEWMLSGSVSATTIETGVSSRIAAGWRSSFGWIGPELLATRDIFNTQVRAGAHLSGVPIGMTEWSIAGGYAHDSFGRGGPYGRLGISYRLMQ